jgi:hypothetical protein
MQTVSDIFERLGGYTAVAKEAGIPATTAHSWQRKNFIPEWRRPTLVALAKKKRVVLSDADFPDRTTPNKEEAA